MGLSKLGKTEWRDYPKVQASDCKINPDRAKGSVLASDAFFPFADGLLEAAKLGVKSVIQPGGSVRDNEVIDAANAENISMIFTGKRSFKH